MDRAHRLPVAVIMVTVVLGALVSVSMLYPYVTSWTTLPIPAGTVITADQAATWVAHFRVGPGGAVLIGAWTAFNGSGYAGLIVVNGTVSKPNPTGIYACPLMFAFEEKNGTLDSRLQPGPYTIYWGTICSYAAEYVITQPVELANP